MSLTIDGAVRYAKLIADEILLAKLVINGKVVEKEFYKKETNGNTITILVYLRGNDVGIVEKLQLVSKDGTVLHDKADIIKKSGTEGFLIGFKFNVVGKEV